MPKHLFDIVTVMSIASHLKTGLVVSGNSGRYSQDGYHQFLDIGPRSPDFIKRQLISWHRNRDNAGSFILLPNFKNLHWHRLFYIYSR